jgi:hypothetical protein
MKFLLKTKKTIHLLIITIIISQNNFSICQIRDPRPKDQANVFWDGTYPLYSLVSDKQILPRKNGDYVYYATTNENPIPYEHTVRKGDVYYEYKFISYEECLEFCNQVRVSKGMPILIDEVQEGVDDDWVLEEMEDEEISFESENQFQQLTNSNFNNQLNTDLKVTTIDSQTKNETNTNSQLRNFPTLTFPIEIISHDPKRNFFKDFTSSQDIGKNLITNPYNVGDESIIKNVDKTVSVIERDIYLTNYDLNTIRKSLPNSEKKLNELNSIRVRINHKYENPDKYNFYMVTDRENMIEKLKNYSLCNRYGNSPNYRIFLYEILHETFSSYYYDVIESSNNYLEGSQEISKEDWNKLVKKDYVLLVEEDKKTEFLFENFGTSERQYLNYELFTTLVQDSIKKSINKQDIFGYTYIGQFENGTRSGYGTLVNLFQDTIYKGIWKEDMPYQGQFYQFNYENRCFGNCENGIGLKITNGCVYRGSFKDGKRDGNGEYIFIPTYDKSTNDYMISTFANGKEGIDRKNYTLNALKLENKNVVVNRYYNGDLYFKSKQVDEEGYQKVLRIFNSGQIFSGSSNFQYDIKKGVVYFQNGNIFLGSDQISSDNIDGEGIFITLNSDGTFNTYMGEFVDGKINGFGTVTYASGKVNDGLFENGNFIKSNDQIAQEKLQLIELEKKKEQEKIDQEKMKWENLAKLMREAREAEIAYQNSPQGKAEKLYHDTHCANCSKKLGQYKYQGFFSTIDGPHCFAELAGKRDPNGGWLFSFEKGYFCSYKCAMDKCEKDHGIK